MTQWSPRHTFASLWYAAKPLRREPGNPRDSCPDSAGCVTVVIAPRASTGGYIAPVWDVGIVSGVVQLIGTLKHLVGLGALDTKNMLRVITKQEGIYLNTKKNININ